MPEALSAAALQEESPVSPEEQFPVDGAPAVSLDLESAASRVAQQEEEQAV